MTNVLKSRWIVWRHDVFLTSWETFWHHDVFLTSWQTFGVFLMPWIVLTWWRLFDKGRTFWRPDVFLTNFLTSWYVLDIMTSWKVLAWHTFGRHDVMNFLTSWCVLYVMIRFWCHWRHNILWLHDNFWLHDKLLTSWQTFDVMMCHDEFFEAKTNFLSS